MDTSDRQQLIDQIRNDISTATSIAEIEGMRAVMVASDQASGLTEASYRDTGPYSDRYQDTAYDDHYKDTPTYRDATG
jgi:hypothetical protein